MITINQLTTYLENFAPLRLAEDWDNVGLLMGDRGQPVQRVMTCLTLTPESTEEAIAEKAQLVVAHHPLPFNALRKLTTDTTAGRMLWQLANAGIAIYSPHTAFDSAEFGINRQLADAIGLSHVCPLRACEDAVPDGGSEPGGDALGAGRMGRIETTTLSDLAGRLSDFLGLPGLRAVGNGEDKVSKIAIACGSGGSFLGAASARGCNGFITGEMTFHDCLAARAQGISVLLTGHFASERFACETLAARMAGDFPDLSVWPSRSESDPIIAIAR